MLLHDVTSTWEEFSYMVLLQPGMNSCYFNHDVTSTWDYTMLLTTSSYKRPSNKYLLQDISFRNRLPDSFRIPSGMLVFLTILLLCYYRGLTHTTKWPGKHEWPQNHYKKWFSLRISFRTVVTRCYFNLGWIMVREVTSTWDEFSLRQLATGCCFNLGLHNVTYNEET